MLYRHLPKEQQIQYQNEGQKRFKGINIQATICQTLGQMKIKMITASDINNSLPLFLFLLIVLLIYY